MREVNIIFVFVLYFSIDDLLSHCVDATCPGGFTLYRGLCLALSNQTMLSWPNALGTCQDLSGTLLTIDNAQKQKNVEDFITDHYNASKRVLDLPPVYQYHYIDELSTYIRQEKYIQFDIKGCNDAHFILSEHRNDSFSSYEIVIGGWGNTQSVIRDCKQCISMATASHSPLYCTEFRPFWVSWGSGTIRVGEGREMGTGTFMEWSDPTSHPVNFLGFSSWSSMMSWRYFKDPYNSNFWLAGSDLRHHGQWEWFPEEDFVVFENWLPDQEESQQHSPTRHCMQMSLYNNFKWVADNCMQNRKFICEHLSTSKSPFG